MRNYNNWATLVSKSVHNKWKSQDKISNLKFLNDNFNKYYAAVIKTVFGMHRISKLHPRCTMTNSSDNRVYGHLKIDEHPVRLSSCLDISNSIQFPIEDYKYFHLGRYIFFTCGDLFLMVDCKELQHAMGLGLIPYQPTKLKNYEIYISDLFNYSKVDLVHWFGLIDFTTHDFEYYDMFNNRRTGNIKNITFSDAFLNFNLRAYNQSSKPKYGVFRIENSDNESYFEWKLFVNLSDLVHFGRMWQWPKTTQGMGNIVRLHTKNLLSKEPMLYHKNVLKTQKRFSYIVLDWTKIDLEQARKYCNLYLKNAPKPRKYNLQWAVKKWKYCRSSEEYTYYKDLFIETNGLQDSYSEEDILFVKHNCNHAPFKYNKNKKYNFYKSQ